MKTMSLNQMEMVEGGKFWGSGPTSCSAVGGNNGVPVQYYWKCTHQYYFWIDFGSCGAVSSCNEEL